MMSPSASVGIQNRLPDTPVSHSIFPTATAASNFSPSTNMDEICGVPLDIGGVCHNHIIACMLHSDKLKRTVRMSGFLYCFVSQLGFTFEALFRSKADRVTMIALSRTRQPSLV
jgi:hypothetical protein